MQDFIINLAFLSKVCYNEATPDFVKRYALHYNNY